MSQSTVQQLANRLQGFDYYFEMSDSSRVWDKWSMEKDRIKQELKELASEDLIQVKSLLTLDDSTLLRHFTEFKGLQEPTEKRSIKSEVFTTAWNLVKSGVASTISRALVLAWRRVKILSSLRKGIAYFTYIKASGEAREAIGTLNQGNYRYVPKGSNRASRLDVVKYFDIGVRGWRSFRLDRLVSIAA